MDWLSGKKTYIIAALVALATGAEFLGLITVEVYGTILGLLGAGGVVTMRQAVEKSGPADKQAGYATVGGMLATTLILLAVLTGCAVSLQPAKTFTEQVAYVDAGATGAQRTLADLTCRKYAAGVCTEVGRPLHPAKSQGYFESLVKARRAARLAAGMPAAGGDCLGEPSTPTACLALARSILDEVQKILTDMQKKGAP